MRPSQPPAAGVKTLTRVLYRMVQLTAICSSLLVASQCAPGQSTGRDDAVDVPAQAPAGQTGSKSLKTKLQGVDILSDTQGVDFDPYIKEISHSIFSLWMNYIPADARSPTFAKGQTLIRFTIAQDGSCERCISMAALIMMASIVRHGPRLRESRNSLDFLKLSAARAWNFE
jgi:hypothetical protein